MSFHLPPGFANERSAAATGDAARVELPPHRRGHARRPQMSYPARSPQVPRAHIHPPPLPLRCRRRCHARCRPPRGWIGRWAGRLKLLVTRQQLPLPSCCRCWPSRCCLRGCSRCCSPRCCPLCRAAWPWLPWPQLCASLSRACRGWHSSRHDSGSILGLAHPRRGVLPLLDDRRHRAGVQHLRHRRRLRHAVPHRLFGSSCLLLGTH